MKLRTKLHALSAMVLLAACSGTDDAGQGDAAGGTGGAVATGGTSAVGSGGATSSGGSSSGGALPGMGGASSTTGGTAQATGGSQPTTGGALATGGTPSTGGASPAGGAAVGGTSSGGATQGSGGVPNAGGVTNTGGALQAGGAAGADTGGSGSSGAAGFHDAGGSAGADTGGAGSSGVGGAAPQCDTAWDTYPSKEDGLALTPPMGWNSWNVFHENINENQIREIADAMVSSGMRDAGYLYLNLDDRWMDDDGRDGQGNLVADNVRFPSGIAALADYVHGLGMKLGVYGDRGTMTCANVPESGSYGNETRDAQTFADWGVDYLKYDNCNIPPERNSDQAQREDYERMSAALKATGRPIVFSICAWDAKAWMPNAGHLWRSTWDIDDCWDKAAGQCAQGSWQRGILQIIDENNETPEYAGPGHWNDPDMLEVGNGRMTNTEYTAHFSLWAIMAAPLIAGNDLRNMSSETRDILTNEEVIAVDQDPAGIQGTRVVDDGDLEVWMKPLCNHDGPEKAVVLLNRSGGTANVSVSFDAIGISGSATVRDLWAHADLGEFNGSFSADVPSHGVVMVKIVDTDG